MKSLFSRPKDESANPAPDSVYNWRVYALACSAAWGSSMFGYDSAFIGGTMALPSFRDRFGLDEHNTNLAALRANIVSTFQAGCFFGVIFCYHLVEKFGHRWVLMGCGAIFNLGAVIQICRVGDLAFIYAGRVLTGLGVGAGSMIVPIYISESGPPAIRGRLIGVFEIFLQISQIFGFWVNYGVNIHISADSNAQWRLPFALQLVPGSLLVICMFLQPESPRWLLNAGKVDEARKVLQRLRQLPADDAYLQWEVNSILQQIEQEDLRGGKRTLASKLKEIFGNPKMRLRLGLGVAMFVFQNMSGINALNYYSPSIFKSIGFTGTSVGLLATGIFGIIKAASTTLYMIWGVDKLGRRMSLIIGSFGAAVALYYLAAFTKLSKSFEIDPDVTTNRSAGAYVAIVMVYVFAAFYAISWNGIPWIFAAEIFPAGIRSVCLVFTTCTQWLAQFVVVYATPYMMQNITYGTFLIFATSVVLAVTFTFFCIPETKGILVEEMDILFDQTGLPSTWRGKANDIIQERRRVGHEFYMTQEEKFDAEHKESTA